MTAGLIPSADSPALLLASEPEAAALTAQQRRDLPGQALTAGKSARLACAAQCAFLGWHASFKAFPHLLQVAA